MEQRTMKQEIFARVFKLSDEDRELFEERAAIMQFDGGMTEERAEFYAIQDVNRVRFRRKKDSAKIQQTDKK